MNILKWLNLIVGASQRCITDISTAERLPTLERQELNQILSDVMKVDPRQLVPPGLDQARSTGVLARCSTSRLVSIVFQESLLLPRL